MEKKYKIKIDKESFVSVADLRKNLSKYSKRAKESPVIVINKSKPEYALVDIEFLKKFEEMEEMMEDQEIARRLEKDKDNPKKWITEEAFKKELKDEGIVL